MNLKCLKKPVSNVSTSQCMEHRNIGVCAVLLIAVFRISALSQPPTGFIPKPVTILLPPSPTHPLSVLIRRPSPLLPNAPESPPLHPSPGLLDPSSGTPCQQHVPFRFPVHRLHWSCHSLSPTMPLPSVIRHPDQCRPRTPYPRRILHPLPSTNPPGPST